MPARRFAVLCAALASLSLAACGGDVTPAPVVTVSVVVVGPSQPQQPKCAEVFRIGQHIDYPPDVAQRGCLDPDGGTQIVGSIRCADGRHLYSVDPPTGAPRGFGFHGDVFHAVPVDFGTDEGYGEAYRACQG